MKSKELALKIEHDFGEEVEFAIKQGKDTGIVTNIILRPDAIVYCVTWSNKVMLEHYGFELNKKA